MFAAERAVVIGLDAPITKSILKYSEKGKLPNITRLIKNGVWGENCLVPHPTITPPNWTTIVTGAWPGTHGITCFHMHKPGWPLDYCPQAFSSLDCEAEYIWQAAEKTGKRTILLNYPSTWPPKGKNLVQMGGAGLHINSWRMDRDGNILPRFYIHHTVADEQLISTEEYPLADTVKLKQAEGWEGLPDGKYLEAEVRLGHRNTYDKVQPVEGFILVHGSEGKGYRMVSFAPEKTASDILFTLGEGEWSERQLLTFQTDRGEKRAVFKAKLVELSTDGRKLRLYFTPFCQLDGWSYPPEVAKELENVPGLPAKVTPTAHRLGWVDSETWLELMREEHTWLGEAAAYLLKKYNWTLFFMQAHAPDHFYHAAMNKIDPQICKDNTVVEEYTRIEEEMYISLDEMVGKILSAVDEKTLVFMVSDHGATPTEGRFDQDFKSFAVSTILSEAGLLAYKTDQKTGEKAIDWSRTKAVPQRSCFIYVNLKGRDPDGIVEPEDYDGVRDEIINALYNYTDPKTGKKPIVFALKKEDARVLGLYGDRIGDVVYGVRAEVSGEHGRQLTTGEYGVGSMKGLLIIAGPNIKKGCVLKRTVWLTDVVPTICYLLGLPIPKDAEGAIIYQALGNPDYLIEELDRLKRNYDRLKAAYEEQRSLTHEYE
ncbi:MAG: alkaline phosphatase family protein [Candidatus Bathyarchaeia archaeon]